MCSIAFRGFMNARCTTGGFSARSRGTDVGPVCPPDRVSRIPCHERAINVTEVLGAFGLSRVMSTMGKAGANPDEFLWRMLNRIRESGGTEYFRALTGGQVPDSARFEEDAAPRGFSVDGTQIMSEPQSGKVIGPKGVGWLSGLASGFYNGSLGAGATPIRPLAGLKGEFEAAAAGDKPKSPTIEDIIDIIKKKLTGIFIISTDDREVPSPGSCPPLFDDSESPELPVSPGLEVEEVSVSPGLEGEPIPGFNEGTVLTEPLESRNYEPISGLGGIRPRSPVPPGTSPTGKNITTLPDTLNVFGAIPVVPFSKQVTPLVTNWKSAPSRGS